MTIYKYFFELVRPSVPFWTALQCYSRIDRLQVSVQNPGHLDHSTPDYAYSKLSLSAS